MAIKLYFGTIMQDNVLAALILDTYGLKYQKIKGPHSDCELKCPVLDTGEKIEGLENIVAYALQHEQEREGQVYEFPEECDYVLDQMNKYVAGGLDTIENQRVEKHILTRCKTCTEDLRLEICLRQMRYQKQKTRLNKGKSSTN